MNEQMILGSSSKPTYRGDWKNCGHSLPYFVSGKEEGPTRSRNMKTLKLNESHLLHLQHVDAKVGQVLSQVGVQDHVILII